MFWADGQLAQWPKGLSTLQALGATKLIAVRMRIATKGRRNDDVINRLRVSAVVGLPGRTIRRLERLKEG
jgi:hypothetical protein